MVGQQHHISTDQKEQLAILLNKYKTLFDGKLTMAKVKPVELELKPGAKPYHAKPFPVPKALEHLLKQECHKFEKLGIWQHGMDTEWAAGTFPMPKKTGDIRTTMDFRELNKWLVRKPYPLPKIQDLLQKLEKFKYATALDLK